MKVTYIYHSGFLIETASGYYIFDYYKGELPAMDPDKPVVVFASHHHEDHYNPEIFRILKDRGMTYILAVLAKDIFPHKHPEGIVVLSVHGKKDYELPHGEKLHTLISNDSGVAFLLTTDEGTIYHSGDLNDWTWEGESEKFNQQIRECFRHRINEIRDTEIDVAMLPLDSRQEHHYADGTAYFLSVITPREVYPMHYWQKPEVIDRFVQEYPQYRAIIKNTEDYAGGTPCSLK